MIKNLGVFPVPFEVFSEIECVFFPSHDNTLTYLKQSYFLFTCNFWSVVDSMSSLKEGILKFALISFAA